ncbi:hypothetical protein [Rhizobium sp. MHM7A]|uniref:hypothetical protein n=1 Tax=Rhizobium sp. MHM7A TaxID=2583233 RepID=UPI0011068324|nr:hypothetical protein [Rhizobium sp. MHM7A]TLX17167.1 hypothetical protein FFR93_07610 [Rhizobium sp. MHM7A]
MAMEPGYDGGQFPLRRIIVRHCKNDDGTITTTVEGAGPWYSRQSTTTSRTGKVTTQLGGEIFGTGQQTVSRILIEHLSGFSAVVNVPCIDKYGHPSSEGRIVTEEDLEGIARTLDHGVPLVLSLYDEFKAVLVKKLGVSAPSEDDLYGWCCLVCKASDNGIMEEVFQHFAGKPTTH